MTGPPLGVRYRRAFRQMRSASLSLRALTLVALAVLLADAVSLAAVGQGGGNGRLASGGPGAGTGSNLGAAGPDGSTLDTSSSTTLGPGGVAGSNRGAPGSIAAGTLPGTGTGFGPGGVRLTASDRGVTPTTIKVVFPWPDLGPIGKATGLDTSSEDSVMSINTYVNDINQHGGINGRKIDPLIVSYNPLDDNDMRSKCLSWTQDQKVFAVVDSIGWHDANQLCITQEGHTPLISGWTTAPFYLQEGAPNLWWTGPDDARVVENLVSWAVDTKRLSPKTIYGIVAADRQGDTISLNQYLLPALKRAGVAAPADIESMHFDQSDGADSASQAPLVVTKLKSKGINVVIPLLPFLNLSAFVTEAQQQNYNPAMLLSDYETTLTAGLGLADAGDSNMDNQVGPTSYILGNHDDNRPGGYTPQGLDCYNTWMKANPGATPPPDHHLEATGTAMTWCQNIRLFAQAARMAGPVLTRLGFDGAMAQISSFPGTVVTNLSFSQTIRSGPHLYRTVQIHENGDKRCPKLFNGKDQGSCWLIVPPGTFQEMRSP